MGWNLLHDYTFWDASVDGNHTGTFVNYDLSEKVAANSIAIVATDLAGGAAYVSARPTNSTADYGTHYVTSGRGVSRCQLGNATDDSVVFAPIDSNGTVDIYGSAADEIDYKALGYLDATACNGSVISGSITTSWSDLDLSSLVGSQEVLALIRVEVTSLGINHSIRVRQKGEIEDFTGGCRYSKCDTGISYHLLVPTDSSGIIQWIGSSSLSVDVECISYVTVAQGWTSASTEVFSAASAPATWTELDVSAVTGERSGFALIKIDVASGSNYTTITARGREVPRSFEIISEAHGAWSAIITNGTSGVIPVSLDILGRLDWIRKGTDNNCTVTVIGYVQGPTISTSVGSYFGENEWSLYNVAIDNTAWVSIDFSPWVGNNRALVMVYVRTTGSAANLNFRPSGDVNDYYSTASDWEDGGTNRTIVDSSYKFLFLQTGADGKVEGKNSALDYCHVFFHGWLVTSYSGAAIGTAEAVTSSYVKTDLSSIMGSNRGIGLTKTILDANVRFSYRVPDDTSANYLDINTFEGQPTRIDQPTLGVYTHGLAVFDDNGYIEYGSSSNANVTHSLLSYAPGRATSSTIVRSLAAGVGVESLDLSSIVGSNHALLFLKLRRGSINDGTRYKYGFAPNNFSSVITGDNEANGTAHSRHMGSQNHIVIIPTDSHGAIKYNFSSSADYEITLLDYFAGNAAPSLGAGSPTGSSERPDVTISISWTDAEGISAAGTDVFLTDPDTVVHNAVVNGVFQTGYSGTVPADDDVSGTIEVSTHPSLAPGLWTVDTSIEDQGGLGDATNWTFTVSDRVFRNRVWHPVNSTYVYWKTNDNPDPTGISYPGPGVFGVDTTDYCIESIEFVVDEYRNRVLDPIDGFVYWNTSSPDTSGTSYPGSSPWGSISDYTVERTIRFG